MAKSEVSKLNGRIASWAKRGNTWLADGLKLMHDAVLVAYDNGNIDPMKRIVAALEGQDRADAITILTHVFPLKVADDHLSAVKGWEKKVADMPRIGTVVDGYKSFRKLAADLRPAKEEKEGKPYGVQEYLADLAKINKKAGKSDQVPADLLARMNALVEGLFEAAGGQPADKPEASPKSAPLAAVGDF